MFGSRTGVPISSMRTKQTAVSRSSAESELMHVDVGSRMDGIPAGQLWDGLLETFPLSDDGRDPPKWRASISFHLSTCHVIWLTTFNVKFQSSSPARLFIFEKNEAVIRFIIQGRSPKLTHESRTYPVHLDCLFERSNLDSSISIRHVRTGEKVADMLTEGAFTTIQWKSVMWLFDIHLQPKIKCQLRPFRMFHIRSSA